MVTFREVGEAFLLAHDKNIITAEECFLLNELNTGKNLDFPYWQHDSFELNLLTDAECKSDLDLIA